MLFSPSPAVFPCGTSEIMQIKSFSYPPGNIPIVGVKGKFLNIVVFGQLCSVDLHFKTGLGFQAKIMHH